MRKKMISLILTAVFMFSSLPLSALHAGKAVAAPDTVHIGTLEEFMAFADNCRRDEWSYGKSFVLDQDLSFSSDEMIMVPAFAGSFDGNGHSVKNVHIKGVAGNTGLFGIVYASGTVRNLNVSGTYEPNGVMTRLGGIAGANHGVIDNCEFNGAVTADNEVGGIAGCNFSDGTISNCRALGSIEGKSSVGGIAGVNDGKILSCTNEAKISTTYEEKALTNDQISSILETITMSDNYNILKTLVDLVDTGGIVGVNGGSVEDSVNKGDVGYPHVGYNMGGVAGRSLGLVKDCTNAGKINGRSDVGGIVGQQQPYILFDASGSDLSKLKTQLDDLNKLVDDALSDISGTSSKTRNQMIAISATLDKADAHLKAITDAIGERSRLIDEQTKDLTDDEGFSIDLGDDGNDEDDSIIDYLLTDHFEEPAAVGSDPFDEIRNGINALNDMNERVSKIREDIGREGNELYATLDRLIDQIDDATAIFDTGVQSGVNKLKAINAKAGEISDQIQSMLKKVSSIPELFSGQYEDTSAVDIENAVNGRTTGSNNYGSVTADYTVGGIAGNASFDLDLEPEKAAERRGNSPFSAMVKTKCIVDHCINRGEIVCNQDSGGAVIGSLDQGIVTDCEGYGKLTVRGSYAGGVVGFSRAEIRNCFSKLDMYGHRYVGGIAGFAKQLHDCIAMADIVEADQFIGAVAGNVDEIDSSRIYNNLYYSGNSYGIDGISYSGIAEGKSYEELIALGRLPDSFYDMMLTFEAQGEIVTTITCKYGSAVAAADIPEVPKKEGFRGVWSRTDFSNIVEDEVIVANYTRINTLLASNLNRNGRAIMLTVGDFQADDKLFLTEQQPNDVIADRRYHVTIPDDGQKNHELRYQPENQGVSVYYWLADDPQGVMAMKKAGSFGKYATFDVTGNELDIMIFEIDEPLANFIIFLIFAIPIAIALIIVILIVRAVRKRKKLREKTA